MQVPSATLLLSFLASVISEGADAALLGQQYANTPPHTVPEKRQRCQNSASDRSCWGDFSISTNYEEQWPTTGVTREYWFNLEDTTVSPDGFPRYTQTINGSIPGPTIIADWGDTVKVHLTNSLARSWNGTGIHFHGVRQYNSTQMDGVPSITQCPIAPGQHYAYTWKATQYGSSWYHSHFGLQAWEGVFGGIIIHGPASANYDEDLGSLFLNDWSHQTADELFTIAQTQGPPTLDTGLINGTNVGANGGSRFNTTLKAGKSYRLRLINAALDAHFKFSIDNHTLTVIANDFVPIKPFQTDYLSIGMGQRYDVIINANQTPDNYWIRAVPQQFCSHNNATDNIRGIIHYDSSTSGEPKSSAFPVLKNDDCDDMNMTSLVPYLAMDAVNSGAEDFDVTVALNSQNLYRWYLNSTTFYRNWSEPSLLDLYNHNAAAFSNKTYSGYIVVNESNVWTGVILQTTNTDPHPIHLHGHDFFVIAQGTGNFDASSKVTLSNPPRRDVAMLPSAGHLAIVWKTDNPGTWLCHCHLGWHTETGFALQYIERQSEIVIDPSALQDTCKTWNDWTTAKSIKQDDPGV